MVALSVPVVGVGVLVTGVVMMSVLEGVGAAVVVLFKLWACTDSVMLFGKVTSVSVDVDMVVVAGVLAMDV